MVSATNIATIINQLRILPRFMILTYGFMTWEVTEWFMLLPDPSGPQAALIATVWGAGSVWFSSYTNTGGN